jgi:hypothetical protein
MELLRVTPSAVSRWEETEATIEGRHFHNSVHVDLDDSDPGRIGRVWRATIGVTAVVDREVGYVNTTTLRLQIPAGLPLGPHDLTVTAPGGESATLANALTVVARALISTDPDQAQALGGGPGSGGAEALGGETGSGAGGAPGGETGSGGADALGGAAGLGAAGAVGGEAGAGAAGALGGEAGSAGAGAPGGEAGSGAVGAVGGEAASAGDGGESSLGAQGGLAGQGGAGGGIGWIDQLGPFDPPVRTTNLYLRGSVDDDPSFTADLLELYFCSSRIRGQGLSDIWVSRRLSPSDPWGAPEVVRELDSSSHDRTPGVSADGLTLYFGSNRPGGLGDYDIWVSTRASRQDPWSDPVNVPELSSTAWDGSPQLVASGLQLVLSSTRPGGPGAVDLYWSSRASATAPWDTPTPIPDVNSAASDSEGRLVADGLLLYFSSSRNAASSRDLYVARRSFADDPFSPPQPLTELNTPMWESDPWLSPDLRYIMFASDRGGAYEVYEAWR